MKYKIKDELDGRIRVHLKGRKNLSFQEADIFQYFLNSQPEIKKAKVYERTADASVKYTCTREEIFIILAAFDFDEVNVPDVVLQNSARALNAEYKEKLVERVVVHYGKKMLLPAPVRTVITVVKAMKFISHGVRSLAAKRLDVAVLDATAIAASLLRADYDTASSVMLLLDVGEIMEEWTHKKSVSDLASNMALNIENVWLLSEDDQQVLVPADQIREGDRVVVHMGNVVPFDGTVVGGEGMVNQASMTGESIPVAKSVDGYVYAGTVLEEGELTVEVKQAFGSTRFEKIVEMIEETEKLKSARESRAEHLADRLVKYTLGGTGLVYLATRDLVRTNAVLMVDFSCALKLAMPITVLSAIREANDHRITVKGGKYLEAVAEATTIVFDKTGTLTKALPSLSKIIPFCEASEDDLLRVAACLEEHFPHSIANAVVRAAFNRGLEHDEMHSKVEYVVAHGIASRIGDERIVIGSSHFVFEDEKCTVDPAYEDRFNSIPDDCSHLYLAEDGKLIAVLCIEDPLRPEAASVIGKLHQVGFDKVVMMTGDSERTARAIAAKAGVDEYYAEVLPEDKAAFIEKEKANGRKVVMIGDGINDSPALSAADVGIAISDGAEIAREIADITISADSLREIVVLKKIADAMVKRINNNYRSIVGINGTLIALGVLGTLAPTTSAMLHNVSTLAIGMKSMTNLLDEDN